MNPSFGGYEPPPRLQPLPGVEFSPLSSLRRPCAVLIASASPPDGNAVIKPDTTLNRRAPGWAVGGTEGLGERDAAPGEPQSPCWC